MAILDSLATYLQTEGLGTVGTSIFLSRMPDSPSVCVTLFESQGAGPSHVFGSSVKAVDHQRIRCIARANPHDYNTARTLCNNVRNALGTVRGTTLSGIQILTILPTTEIYPAERDADERPRILCDFTVWLP